MKFPTSAALAAAIAIAGAIGALPAQAHDDAYLDTLKAPHGGQLRMAGAFHYELVVVKDSTEAKDNPVLVYLTDHAGTKIPSAGASGTVTLLAGKQKATANLVPDGDNRLKAVAKYASSPDLKAIVSITPAGQGTEQARFTPMAMAAGGH